MSTTITPKSAQPRSLPTLKQHFLDAYDEEHRKTMRVLRAFPKDKGSLRPHAKAKTARDLAWVFVVEQGATTTALTTGFDFSKPPSFPAAPESFEEVLGAFEQGHDKVLALVRGLRDEELLDSVKFFTGPKTIADIPKHQFLWMMLNDQIHHRGQLSVYLRMADGKVPAIYGPSLDEPWM